MYKQYIVQQITDKERRPFNLKTALKKLIYDGDKPRVICENSATFTMVMSTFTHHEKYVSTLKNIYASIVALMGLYICCGIPLKAKFDNSYIDALKKINHYLAQTFAQDFPFYLVLAYSSHQCLILCYYNFCGISLCSGKVW